MGHNQYESPFCTRYASEEMQYIFSADHKFKTWRKLWIALAKAEQKQGLPITDAQISQLEQFAEEINYISAQASKSSYEGLERIIEALDKAKVRLKANVNFELTMELLLLTIKEN